ncbi:MAG: valine--tRNA ligase [Hyphomicrobiales bacterium]
MLEKTYDPHSIEPRLYEAWEKSGAFKAGDKEGADSFCIVIPPPNVTGSLHMGHALNNTIQDILIRFNRMRGKNVLWQPGTDHAGIATQMVVERQLMERQEPSRWDMGREKFIEKVWDWKAESGGIITGQLRRLGASCDWSRERFTMDEGLSAAVLKVFVQLYKEGLIYKDKRLVNWDPQFETAISDLEVENVEIDGHMWHFKYPLQNGETYEYVERDTEGGITLRETRDYISIATTRPETMLGDGAVAVHPSDDRYASIVGKLCEIPVGPNEHRRFIPIITDEYPDPEFGSGAVKITGAHDFNDYQVARRADIPLYRLMDTRATMRDDGVAYAKASAQAMEIVEQGGTPDAAAVDAINLVPDEYRGLDRFEARKRVVADISAEGLMIGVEEKKVMQPFGDRSKVVIEPMLTDQWFADAVKLAKPAIAAVRDGETRFVPKNWEKTYFEWMENIQPWCISRQLWWGHQIPAWYGPDGEVFVEETENLAITAAERHYGTRTMLTRDEDVLDTWFSSALWPFSTLGWPEETPELQRYYRTNTLVTAFDIIFFWVARMMMFGMHFMKDEKGAPEVPFDDVYIHALVRDEKGAKMSKSKGNVIDPLELVDEYGADALRFTLAAMAAQGRDIKLATSRVEGYRNFATKLWNASRFAEMNECVRVEGFDPSNVTLPVNKWIVSETARTAAEVSAGIEQYRFNESAGALYRFIWNIYCDWYLELIKPALNGDDENAKAETRATAAWALDQIMILLHPFMPFITEELWQVTGEQGPKRKTWLINASWPELSGLEDQAAMEELDWVIRFITEVRSVRSEMNVPAGAKVPCVVRGASDETARRVKSWVTEVSRLARLSNLELNDEIPSGSVQSVLDEATLALPLGDVIDIAGESDRLAKELGKVHGEIKGLEAKLANENFTSKAPAHVVEEQRNRLVETQERAQKIDAALERLKAMA